jgi:hypothetical protein
MAGVDPRWTVKNFSQANPKRPGQDEVPALLRRFAESLDELGAIEVRNPVLHTETTADGPWHSITVSYRRAADGSD